MDYELALVKSVGENEVVLVVNDKEYLLKLSPEEARGLHQVLANNENVLVPFNSFDKKMALDIGEKWNEENLEELQGNDEYEIDDEGRVV